MKEVLVLPKFGDELSQLAAGAGAGATAGWG